MANQTQDQSDRLQTRYLIYETTDLGVNLALRGEELATSSDQARRRFITKNPAFEEKVLTAISENHCRLSVPPPRIAPPVASAKGEEAVAQIELPDPPAGA